MHIKKTTTACGQACECGKRRKVQRPDNKKPVLTHHDSQDLAFIHCVLLLEAIPVNSKAPPLSRCADVGARARGGKRGSCFQLPRERMQPRTQEGRQTRTWWRNDSRGGLAEKRRGTSGLAYMSWQTAWNVRPSCPLSLSSLRLRWDGTEMGSLA
eukprot:725717-Hanusia_phi.AAC.1